MPRIRPLPPAVVNKIAAGEVIERPASVVKELLENSLDAGARRIDVSLGQGGSDLVRVVDDGCGIERDDLPLAVASHATSKLTDAEDLFRVGTLGFRGEALASIAEVSQLLLRSRPLGADSGWQIAVHGGVAGPVEPCGCPPGTAIEVRHLFYNTPVRRKFLRGSQTEISHCIEAFTRLALAYPQVHLTLRHNERLLWDLPPVGNWRERIAAFFGEEINGALIPIAGSDGDVQLDGFVAEPSQSRAHSRLQYLFLNGRFIRDRALQHALQEAYRGLLLSGRYPIAFLRLTVPPESVDVNVHPTKLEVRFADSGRIYALLLATLRRVFLSTDLTTRVRSQAGFAGAGTPWQPTTETGFSLPPLSEQEPLASHRARVVAWATGQQIPPLPDRQISLANADSRKADESVAPPDVDAALQDIQLNEHKKLNPCGSLEGSPVGVHGPPRSQIQAEIELQFETPAGGPLTAVELDQAWPAAPISPRTRGAASYAGRLAHPTPDAEPAVGEPEQGVDGPQTTTLGGVPAARVSAAPSVAGCQIHNRYLVAECPEGLLVIDQHALHERILYERLRSRLEAGRPEIQRLLVNLPVTLPPAEAAALVEAREVLAEAGLELEPFGPDTVLVRGYPAVLGLIDPVELVRQAAELVAHGPRKLQRRELAERLLQMMACKGAVKAGDRLAPEEVAALLAQRDLYRDTHHCPHGRPTALLFTCEELDRRFKRT